MAPTDVALQRCNVTVTRFVELARTEREGGERGERGRDGEEEKRTGARVCELVRFEGA